VFDRNASKKGKPIDLLTGEDHQPKMGRIFGKPKGPPSKKTFRTWGQKKKVVETVGVPDKTSETLEKK